MAPAPPCRPDVVRSSGVYTPGPGRGSLIGAFIGADPLDHFILSHLPAIDCILVKILSLHRIAATRGVNPRQTPVFPWLSASTTRRNVASRARMNGHHDGRCRVCTGKPDRPRVRASPATASLSSTSKYTAQLKMNRYCLLMLQSSPYYHNPQSCIHVI